MSISAHDRKRLWGKAANRCTICGDPLTRPAAGADREAVIGEEAHIIGARPGSARYEPLDPAACDAYENRILVCPSDHSLIDQQPGAWPVSRLHQLKAVHETWVQRQTRRPAREEDAQDGRELHLLLSGEAIVGLVSGADAYQFDHEPFASEVERLAGRALLQQAHDWGEIVGEIGPGGRIDAEKELGDLLSDAMDCGLLLYGTVAPKPLRFEGRQVSLNVAIFYLRRAASIAASGGAPAAAAGSDDAGPRTGGEPAGDAGRAARDPKYAEGVSIITCTNCKARNRVGAISSGTPRCAKCKTALPWVVNADEASFTDETTASVPVVVDFWAGWCGPCRMISPVLEELARAHAGTLKIVKVDVDANPGLAQRFQAMSIPLLVVIRGGAEVDRIVGALPRAALEQRLAPALAA